MAKKNGGSKGGGSGMLSPFYTGPGKSLGPVKPSGKPSLSIPDPIGLTHGKFGKGPGSQNRTQSHEIE